MILATYQPINSNTEISENKFSDLRNYLGYNPIFCFSIESVKDALIKSILAAPNCPEKLIIFETDSYEEIDIIQWNKLIHSKGMDIEDCFTDKGIIYKEFIVKEIENIIGEFYIEDLIFYDDCGLKFGDDFAKQLFSILQQNARCFANSVKYSDNKKSIEFMKKKTYKRAFQYYLFPMIINAYLKEPVLYKFNFDKYSLLKIDKKLSEFYNGFNGTKNMTYEFYDRLYSSIGACFDNLCDKKFQNNDKKIYPNDPCPCGSGKKYKKCCSGN